MVTEETQCGLGVERISAPPLQCSTDICRDNSGEIAFSLDTLDTPQESQSTPVGVFWGDNANFLEPQIEFGGSGGS